MAITQKDIIELLEANIISSETADKIRDFIKTPDQKPTSNKLVIVFSILGALLVGSGVVLIIAHNWEELGKNVQLTIGLMPLLLSQGLAWFAFQKKFESVAWREVTAVLVFFAIATAIAVVGQVYNLHSNYSRFLLTWIVLALPLIYTHRSSLVSLLIWIVATQYAAIVSYSIYMSSYSGNVIAYWYWVIVAVLLLHYIKLIRDNPQSNFTYFHHWILPGSLAVVLAMFQQGRSDWPMPAYMTLFSIFILIGQLKPFQNIRVIANGYLVIGSLGMVALWLVFTFDDFWMRNLQDWQSWDVYEIGMAILLTALTIYLISVVKSLKTWSTINVKSFGFIIFYLLYLLGFQSPNAAQILSNVVVLALGVFTIRDGANKKSLGLLNYGLLIVSALIICRFFDSNLSFVIRGILFILVGVGFFVANYWMSKKKKEAQP